jgi:diguanylate cyclase (GGDEF)-like protein/PAS domain S-box-containing protein
MEKLFSEVVRFVEKRCKKREYLSMSVSDRLSLGSKLIGEHSIFEHILEPIVITNERNEILVANRAFGVVTKTRTAKLIGCNLIRNFMGPAQESMLDEISMRIENEGSWEGEIYALKSDGAPFLIKLSISVLRNQQRRVTHYIHAFIDLTEQQHTEQKLIRLSCFDQLTDLPNRVVMKNRLDNALIQAEKNEEKMAVIYIDIDDFKQLNDSLSHEVGDQVLVILASRLKLFDRLTHTIARMGGDEFAVITYGIRSVNGISQLVNKVLEELTEPVFINNQPIHCTASAGITLFPDDGSTSSELGKNADIAMYRAKHNGGNRLEFFNAKMRVQAELFMHFKQELKAAITENQFELFYQPKIAINQSRPLKMEALVRWNHPTKGLLSPNGFIKEMEFNGLIIPLSCWIINESCRQAREWMDNGYDVQIAINLSAVQFEDDNLITFIGETLLAHNVQPHNIEFEITESAIMSNVSNHESILNKIRQMGFSVALDDFGTGYSSLSYLKRFPVSVLKIDRSFIFELKRDSKDAQIVSMIVALAKVLGLEVVAEGVETKEQAEMLIEMNCDYLQGYYFSKPISASQYSTLLEQVTECDEGEIATNNMESFVYTM